MQDLYVHSDDMYPYHELEPCEIDPNYNSTMTNMQGLDHVISLDPQWPHWTEPKMND